MHEVILFMLDLSIWSEYTAIILEQKKATSEDADIMKEQCMVE